MHQNQMVNPYALDPEPNAIVWDWATIFILGVGNLAALDFQARSMASKTPKIARRGNFIAGLLVIFIGVPCVSRSNNPVCAFTDLSFVD